MSSSPHPLLSRRSFLRVGSLGMMGITLPRLLAANATPMPTGLIPRADSCLILFLNGGPSHLDMWDMKPDAPAEIRGEFSPIRSSLPGVDVCELLPKLARQMHQVTLIRSMHHGVNNAHAAAVYCAMTGHDRGELGGGAQPSDNPTPGSVLSLVRPTTQSVPHVVLPYVTREGAGGPPQPGFFGGFLGRAADPLFVLKDPNSAEFSIPELTLSPDVSPDRLAARRNLVGSLERRIGVDQWEAMNQFQQRAMQLLTSTTTQRAFQIDREPVALRDAYGRNIYGQSTLLARRLLEAGTRVVTLSWAPDANATWDTHGNNFANLRERLLPQFDSACATLIADLADRGMLERTLVAVMGDFGRTPRINANAGRDHWNFCYSVLLAGGGVPAGKVIGASDKIGGFPASQPHTPADLVSTIYQLLGVRPDLELYDSLQRPHRLVPSGEIIRALIA